jgi:NAD(P)-dependent dehydrogenase (short-subunit alcohol dehydrogenase family)
MTGAVPGWRKLRAQSKLGRWLMCITRTAVRNTRQQTGRVRPSCPRRGSLCYAYGPQRADERRGSVLIVGSTVVCAPSYGGAAYRASKMALRSYMETLAIEAAPFGIRVNMPTPGPLPTALMGDLPTAQRVASAREVPLGQREGELSGLQGAAVFLVSDKLSSYVTGAELHVDGGWHLRPMYMGPLDAVRELNSTAVPRG